MAEGIFHGILLDLFQLYLLFSNQLTFKSINQTRFKLLLLNH